jgi:CheY-like chemotaxis protein
MKKVLLIEDSEKAIEAAKSAAKELGVELKIAKTLKEAEGALKEGYDAIFVDAFFPYDERKPQELQKDENYKKFVGSFLDKISGYKMIEIDRVVGALAGKSLEVPLGLSLAEMLKDKNVMLTSAYDHHKKEPGLDMSKVIDYCKDKGIPFYIEDYPSGSQENPKYSASYWKKVMKEKLKL